MSKMQEPVRRGYKGSKVKKKVISQTVSFFINLPVLLQIHLSVHKMSQILDKESNLVMILKIVVSFSIPKIFFSFKTLFYPLTSE